MTVINPPGYLHNIATHTGQVDRIAAVASGLQPNGAGLTWQDGVRGINDLKVAARATPNMSVDVAAGLAFVKGTLNAFQGVYVVPNDGVINLAIGAAHATLNRRDLIVVRVQDSFYSGAANTATIEVVPGTAASSPVDPVVPANCRLLARVTVNAGATSIGAGSITDLRAWTAALGGLIPCMSTARPAHQEALTIYEMDTDRIQVSDGTSWFVVWEKSSPWIDYTPTLNTGVVGNGTIMGRYRRMGNMVTAAFRLTPGTSTSLGSAPRFSMPVTPVTLTGLQPVYIGNLFMSTSLSQNWITGQVHVSPDGNPLNATHMFSSLSMAGDSNAWTDGSVAVASINYVVGSVTYECAT